MAHFDQFIQMQELKTAICLWNFFLQTWLDMAIDDCPPVFKIW